MDAQNGLHKPSLGSCEVPRKICAQMVLPYLRLMDTHGQRDTQSIDIDVNVR